MGRETILTTDPSVADEICRLVEEGSPVVDACDIVGIAPATYCNWVNKGKAGESPYVEFLERFRRARANGRKFHVDVIRKAGPDDWRASAFFLERSDPKHWGRQEKLRQEISGPNGSPIPVDISATIDQIYDDDCDSEADAS